MPRLLAVLGLALLALVISQRPVLHAQDVSNCASTQSGNPPRTVYDCANGLLIEAEAFADVQSLCARDQCDPKEMAISDGAVLVDMSPGSGPFQVRTPHAIASVRGTQFYVDVETLQTAVFVVDGVVAVARTDGADEVELEAGEGVTVKAGEPLLVRVWAAEKVAALVARFGR